jgi:aspartyl/asparaginyl-tRNA synthetase
LKSFKLISLQIVTEEKKLVDVELADGLIINKEDDASTWILEAFVKERDFQSIEHFVGNVNEKLMIQAVITKKGNDPATFKTIVRTIKKVDGHISLLLEGTLQKSRSKYAELLLEDLINNGKSGDELIEQFKEKIRSRPSLVAAKKGTKK